MRLAIGQPGGRVEDVGGELVQKVKQLEEERKNLRTETQNHHQHIDQGINTLQERISELEQSKDLNWVLHSGGWRREEEGGGTL